MKKKELIKAARSISEDVIRQQVEREGLLAKDYFLWEIPEGHLVCYWRNGMQYVSMNDDEVNNFAVAEYLLARSVRVYSSGDNPPVPPTTD